MHRTCQRCAKPTPADALRPVAPFFRWLAALSLGAVHAGWWLWEELSNVYCQRCRRWLSALCVVLAGLVLAGVVAAFRWAHRRGFL